MASYTYDFVTANGVQLCWPH